MPTIDVVNSVYARIENRPGAFARVAQILGERRLTVEALALETQGGEGFARILTRKAKEAVGALSEEGVEAYLSEVVVAPLPKKTSDLARVTAELAAAGLNVEGVVTMPDGRVAYRTNDPEMAAAVLRKL